MNTYLFHLLLLSFLFIVVLAEDEMPVSLSISPVSSGEHLRVECRSYISDAVNTSYLSLWSWSPEAIWKRVAYAEKVEKIYSGSIIDEDSPWIRNSSVSGNSVDQNVVVTFQWECLRSYRFYCELSYVWPDNEGKVSRESPMQEVAKPC